MTSEKDNPEFEIGSDEEVQKNVAFYSASIQGWIATRQECDKTIVAISAGGIGLLVSLMLRDNALTGCMVILCLLGIVFFLISILSGVAIFKLNARYLASVIKDSADKPNLKVLDFVMLVAFCCALLLSTVLGISVGVEKITSREDQMVYERNPRERNVPGEGEKSLDGLEDLKPPPASTEQGDAGSADQGGSSGQQSEGGQSEGSGAETTSE